ncbi:serine/threonine protein phosphatase, BSU1, Metallo-dependent phosphatase-like protein [Artemisia annua]|uniref:Serine/threonine protein phosphatase, BSU1, Metallo-dependent phosphatase-like protein n=1 Tax=Artemisia annua TaxID=35608 RepID=A0A2U1MMG5_ARTAN|nr:serine/threonine protein phosphatase, BSU1, Metallo-dependent phosphatase-like protein [Artemisia annua]
MISDEMSGSAGHKQKQELFCLPICCALLSQCAWQRFNQLFNHLPLAALIEQKIICMHGGIGRSIHSVEQIEKIERPINMDAGSVVLMDLLWSDPTENDSVEGLRPNARGPGLVTFGVVGNAQGMSVGCPIAL